MYNLQAALDERLASLKGSKSQSKKSPKKKISIEHIERSLKQAGILNSKGKMVNKVAS